MRTSFDRSADDKKENAMSRRGPNDNDMEPSTVNSTIPDLSLTSVTQCDVLENIHTPLPSTPRKDQNFLGAGVVL